MKYSYKMHRMIRHIDDKLPYLCSRCARNGFFTMCGKEAAEYRLYYNAAGALLCSGCIEILERTMASYAIGAEGY